MIKSIIGGKLFQDSEGNFSFSKDIPLLFWGTPDFYPDCYSVFQRETGGDSISAFAGMPGSKAGCRPAYDLLRSAGA